MYSTAAWAALFSVCATTSGMYGPLVKLSHVDGQVEYDTSQVVFLSELVKLAISILMLSQTSAVGRFSLKEGLPYFVPGFCYFVNNNLNFIILAELDPATFSMLSNIKVVTTTILYVLVMKRYPNKLQYTALAILTAAGIIHSYGTAVLNPSSDSEQQLQMRASPYGITLLLFSVSNSGFAAVYTEFIVKKNFNVSLYKQNIYLYTSGLLYNAIAILRGSATVPHSSNSWTILSGFNIYTWLIILNTAMQGLGTSVIMKYSTNITKLVVTCASLIVSTSASILIFNLVITSYFIISLSLVILGIVLYNIPSTKPTHMVASKFVV